MIVGEGSGVIVDGLGGGNWIGHINSLNRPGFLNIVAKQAALRQKKGVVQMFVVILIEGTVASELFRLMFL